MDLGANLLSGEAARNAAANAGSAIMTTLMIILWVAIAVGIVVFALYWKSFKHKVRIRTVINNRRIVTDDRAKVRKKEGVEYWFLRKRRVFIPIPPESALDVDNRGRVVAECYHKSEGGKPFGYYWIEDVDKTINSDDPAFKPLPTEKQSAMINRMRRAEERKGKSLFENLVPIVMTVGMIAAIALPLIFYGDLAEANQDHFERVTQLEMAIANKLDDVVSKAGGCYSPVDYSSDQALSDQVKPPEVSG